MRKQHITLTAVDKTYLEVLVKTKDVSLKMYRRAVGLLELDRGKTYQAVSKTLGVSSVSVTNWKKRYETERLGCLEDKPRSGRPVEIDGEARAKVTALACSEAPQGYGKWSLRLLASRVVELEFCEHISHSTVSTILKKTNSAPI